MKQLRILKKIIYASQSSTLNLPINIFNLATLRVEIKGRGGYNIKRDQRHLTKQQNKRRVEIKGW